MTHTHANLEVSRSTYDEIAGKLKAAGYDHAFGEDGVIDMHGIGMVRGRHEPLMMRPHTDAELHEMAESEGDGCISVGGLAVELGMYRKPEEDDRLERQLAIIAKNRRQLGQLSEVSNLLAAAVIKVLDECVSDAGSDDPQTHAPSFKLLSGLNAALSRYDALMKYLEDENLGGDEEGYEFVTELLPGDAIVLTSDVGKTECFTHKILKRKA